MLLYLGPENQRIKEHFDKLSVNYIYYNKLISLEFCIKNNISTIISFGYRYIITKEIIEKYSGQIFNVHISYLPYNRGADPNLWSFIDNTPKGVTIHEIDEGIDTGSIYVQEKIESLDVTMTFEETYNILIEKAANLLIRNLYSLMKNEIIAIPQKGYGSFHKKKDKEKYKDCFTQEWKTKINTFLTCVKETEI